MRFTQTNGERGFGYYARMLEMLRREGPMTVYQMADAGIFKVEGLQAAFPMIHQANMVHIHDWAFGAGKKRGQGRPSPVFAFGPGEDAICRTGAAYRRAARAVESFKVFSALWSALQNPISMAELAEKLGLARCTVGDQLGRLRTLNLARIAKYDKQHGDYGLPIPLYQLGSGPSAARPKRMSRKETNRAHWHRRALRKTLEGTQIVVTQWQPPKAAPGASSVFFWRGAA